MHKKLLFTFLIIGSISLNGFSQDGKLNKGKQSLKTTNSSNSTSKNSTKTSNSNTSDSSFFDDDVNPFLKIFGYIFAYTAYGVLIESPFEKEGRMHSAEISNYAYKENHFGNFIYTDSTNYNITRFDFSNNFVIENSNLYGNNFGVNFRFLKRFALDVDYLYLTENVNDTKDSFSLYSALLKYYRIRTQRFEAWFGFWY